MDDSRKRAALAMLRKQASAASLGDRLPENRRASIVITITPSGDEHEVEREEDEEEMDE